MTLKQIAHQVTKKDIISAFLVTLLLTVCSAALLAQENANDLFDAADPTVATVIFCQSVITPTPTPAVPEPGSGLLLLLSVALLRWKRRGAKLLSLLRIRRRTPDRASRIVRTDR